MNADQKIPWFEPLLDAADAEAVRRVVADGYVNEGPECRRFEQELCTFFGVKHAVVAPNCTTSIALALMAIGVRHGDTVLVPDITFVGTASAVRLAGAEPILVDVDPRTFTMDPADARRKLAPTTRAIVPVHLNGRAADVSALRALAKEKGLALIEDSAQAIASRNTEGWLGTLSDAGCFSLAPTKIITSGQGGFILTNRQDVRDNLVRLKDHGRLSRASDVHPVTGFNFKFTDIQAALARAQFAKLPARIRRSTQVDRLYREKLAGVPGLEFPPRPESGGYLMWPDFTAARRDEICRRLAERQIFLRPFWPALHTQPAYATPGAFPGAEEASAHACWLPCSPGLDDAQIDRVVSAVRDALGVAAE